MKRYNISKKEENLSTNNKIGEQTMLKLKSHEEAVTAIITKINNHPEFEYLNRLLSEGTILVNTDREYAAIDFLEERYTDQFQPFVLTIEPNEPGEELADGYYIEHWDGKYGYREDDLYEALKATESHIANVYWTWEQEDESEEYTNDQFE